MPWSKHCRWQLVPKAEVCILGGHGSTRPQYYLVMFFWGFIHKSNWCNGAGPFCAPKSSDLECRDCRGHTVSACQARTMEMTSPPTTFFFLLRKSSAIALCAFAIYSAQHLINTMSLTARLIRPTARVVSTRGFATAAVRSQKYTLPDLPYGYGELEPAVSGQIMEVGGYCKPQ